MKQTLSDTKRAVIWFLAVYVLINIPATGLYFLIALIMGIPLSGPNEIIHDPAYLLSQKLYPILNLLFWLFASWKYFSKSPYAKPDYNEAIKLGLFWLIIALPMDLIVYVLIPTPLSLSFNDFYHGQFPWIYFTYLSVFISPLFYIVLKKKWQINSK